MIVDFYVTGFTPIPEKRTKIIPIYDLTLNFPG